MTSERSFVPSAARVPFPISYFVVIRCLVQTIAAASLQVNSSFKNAFNFILSGLFP